MKKKYNIAIVGCGRILKNHLTAISNNNFNLIALCDTNLNKLNSLDYSNVPKYSNYDEMLQTHKEIDIVSILTPSGLHSKHCIDIVRKYQKNIIVEKPMALNLYDAEEMIKTCDEYCVKLLVVKQNRFNLPILKLKEFIDTKRFGKIVLGTIRVRWSRTQEYYDMDSWRGTWSLDGGVLANQASHHIDLLLWTMGEPISVFAKSGTYLHNIEVDDTAVAIVKFKSGALGLIEATTCARPHDLEGSISILGEKGNMVIGGFAVNKIISCDFTDMRKEEKDEIFEKYNENPPNVYGFGHIKFYKNVYESLLHRKKALVDGLEGYKSLELINAIYESVETGKEIFLRYQPKFSRMGK
ncbi:MAG TPA: Gfo/Idh/MocA family oxidoreductase [Ignavibacteriales bacterium]|nr:Gfo/Idh/MocA family oxidoreductase [Ignavibacteriales bacterium]